MRGPAEHVDVGARAPDAVLAAFEHDDLHGRVLEADAVQRIVQFDIDAEVVRFELELVAGLDAAFLVDVELETCDVAVDSERPVAVLRGIRGKAHQLAIALLEQQRLGHGVHRLFSLGAGTARSRSFRDCLTVREAVSLTASARAYRTSRLARMRRRSSSASFNTPHKKTKNHKTPNTTTRDICSSGLALIHTQ